MKSLDIQKKIDAIYNHLKEQTDKMDGNGTTGLSSYLRQTLSIADLWKMVKGENEALPVEFLSVYLLISLSVICLLLLLLLVGIFLFKCCYRSILFRALKKIGYT